VQQRSRSQADYQTRQYGLDTTLYKHPVPPIARRQRYHLPPVAQEDTSYPSEIGKLQVQLRKDDLATEAGPGSGLARLREENASCYHLCVVVVR
jgi:hypothetical protein